MKLKFAGSVTLALALALGVIWGGAALSGWASGAAQESAVYRQSVVISSLFSQGDEPSLGTALTDARTRGLLLEFARALTSAYVTFELIPYGQLETFGVVYASLDPRLEIESFAYRGHDLIITGFAPDEESYHKFLAGLRGSGYFGEVRGSFSPHKGGIRFEIECLAADRQGLSLPVLGHAYRF